MTSSKPLILLALCLAAPAAAGAPLSSLQELGRQLFFDSELSSPAGQACGSCHAPEAAFADPARGRPTSKGALKNRFGNRNTPTAMYTAFSPLLHQEEGAYVGGVFLDGRATNLETQAQGPFLNPLEMANPDKATVVAKVRSAPYAALFKRVFGVQSLADTEPAYAAIGTALAAFERSPFLSPFSSKYDAYLAGRARLTEAEQRGLALYEDPLKGNCAACHPSRPAEDGTPPLFTDFTYDNLGVPRNPDNPFYALPKELNPDGANFTDKGLGQALGKKKENGKFKVPTLRNIALTGPYMHNGYFKTLRGAVDFYNSRDVKPACPSPLTRESQALTDGCWPQPEVLENVNREELGNLRLSNQEVSDITAFLRTLTDGFWEPPTRQ